MTAYEMRISDWSSDVCSSDLHLQGHLVHRPVPRGDQAAHTDRLVDDVLVAGVVTQRMLELEVLEHGDERLDVPESGAGLGAGRQRDRRPHLLTDRLCHLVGAALVNFRQLLQDRKSTRLNSSHSCAPRKPSSAFKKKETKS